MKSKYKIYEMNKNLGMDYVETVELTWSEMIHKCDQGFYCESID